MLLPGVRPDVVPAACVIFSFIGNLAEPPRATVFTIKYSVRTAMEAVYRLQHADRGAPEMFAACYKVRVQPRPGVHLLDAGSAVTGR